jgi:hypothetical protein
MPTADAQTDGRGWPSDENRQDDPRNERVRAAGGASECTGGDDARFDSS